MFHWILHNSCWALNFNQIFIALNGCEVQIITTNELAVNVLDIDNQYYFLFVFILQQQHKISCEIFIIPCLNNCSLVIRLKEFCHVNNNCVCWEEQSIWGRNKLLPQVDSINVLCLVFCITFWSFAIYKLIIPIISDCQYTKNEHTLHSSKFTCANPMTDFVNKCDMAWIYNIQ